jgi:acetyl esterase
MARADATNAGHVDDEAVLDPDVVELFEANPFLGQPFEDFSPEMLALARSPAGFPPTRELAQVSDDVVDDIPIRTYRHAHPTAGLVVYFPGGGHCIGSVGLMDNMARELAHGSGATVVSVEYRLAPEHPYPAGLDDCDHVTQWVRTHAADFGADPAQIVVAGESAGGNLAAAVTLRMRDRGDAPLWGQVLLYPRLDTSTSAHRSRRELAGIVLTQATMDGFWERYTAGRDLSRDPYAVPLAAASVAGVPPALLVLGGADPLRDEGRAYAERLLAEAVPVEEVCIAGQPHGFLNFGVPRAAETWGRVGAWLRARWAAARLAS